jgi:hypothetical protein
MTIDGVAGSITLLNTLAADVHWTVSPPQKVGDAMEGWEIGAAAMAAAPRGGVRER